METSTLLRLGAEAMANKQYESAVEIYSELCQLANMNQQGKDDPDCMFLYGKALFENAVANSDVLGAKKGPQKQAGGDEQKEGDDNATNNEAFHEQLAEEEEQDDEESASAPAEEEQEDEDDPEEVAAPASDEEQAEDDDDDFTLAWEILDLTRVLYETQLAESTTTNPLPSEKPYFVSDSAKDVDPLVQDNKSLHIVKRLADTLDLLGELSLETENFQQAAHDFTQMLKLKQDLYPDHAGQMAEAHYKLSLAWEFVGDSAGDQKAIECMQNALRSVATKVVMAKQNGQEEDVDTSLVAEMKARLVDLKARDLALKQQKDDIMQGLAGIGSTAEAVNTSAAKVNDLSQMVKKRKADKKPTTNDASKRAKN